MNKKKRSKRGQITVFIILGLVILFAAIFVFLLSKEIQMGELGTAQEDVISKAFRKEGLQLCIEDILKDGLKDGLELIGRQGGMVWKGDFGGINEFEEWSTGREHLGEKIAYAITEGEYLLEGTYPCEDGDEPDFCKYQYPNGSILPNYPVKFGEIELSRRSMETNLKRFLTGKVNDAVKVKKECTREDVSGVEVIPEDLEIGLDILSDGIKVEAKCPLTLNLAGEDFFHLAEFDFFYPSDIKKLLEAAITDPLALDQSFVDFDYTEERLASPSFDYPCFDRSTGEVIECSKPMRGSEYMGLGIKLEEPTELENGDDFFKFKVEKDIIGDEPYFFQFVRQNRPPALDYVERDYCDEDGYDYLVIPGDEDYENIDITLFALDPDDDDISYWVDDTPLPGNNFFVSQPAEGRYEITAIAEDEHGLSDQQKVRVLVDRMMKTDVSLKMPYEIRDYVSKEIKPYEDLFSGDTYWVSNEDPVFIDVSIPRHSLVEDASPETTLIYNKETDFNYILPESLSLSGEGGCFSLPWLKSETCSIEEYTDGDIENWKDNLDEPYGHFKELTGNIPGELILDFAITYCGKNEQSDTKSVDIMVRECVPHRNVTHPWAFPNHEYKYESDEEGKTDSDNFVGMEEINPFLATHSCCGDDWNILEGVDCFVNPALGCYGGIDGFAGKDEGYILAEEYAVCDGKRGNICGEESGKKYRLRGGELLCGGEGKYADCGAPIECNEQAPWSLIGGEGWCYGENVGCENFCSKENGEEIVYRGFISGGPYYFSEITTNLFKCGCELTDNGNSCDPFFTGAFGSNWRCQNGDCIYTG